MNKEDKELLLKDLSARLPYGVKILVNNNVNTLEGIHIPDGVVEFNSCLSCNVEEVKLYLYPLSSMTEEQEYEWDNLFTNPMVERVMTQHTREYDLLLRAKSGFASTEYLDKNFFDYRGLIPMGLALDATGLNIY
jgi:hypothetical protein